ncbi:MAG TPA: MFS transporter, partial [Gemmatimonadales bacterium]|nr:MFS transporter [Gemmatimonadales bacterium]
VGAGTSGVVLAALADSTSPGARARLFGHLGAATSLGAVVGPLLVLLGHRAGWVGSEVILAAVVAVVLVLAWWRMPAGVGAAARGARDRLTSAAGRGVRADTGSLRIALGMPARVRSLILIYAVAIGAGSGIPMMLPVLLDAVPGAPAAGWCLMFLGAAGALLRAGLVGPVVARIGERRLLIIGLAAVAAGVCGLAASAVPGVLPVSLGALALGTALTFPALTALLSHATAPAERGATMGAQQALGGVSRAVVPLGIGAAVAAGAMTEVLVATAAVLLVLAGWVRHVLVERGEAPGRARAAFAPRGEVSPPGSVRAGRRLAG